MAYNGFLLQVGGYVVPMNFIKIESYSVTYSTMDLDPYRDANGVLHRNALGHKVGNLVFETPIMYQRDFAAVMANIRSQYTNAVEKKVSATFYVPELDTYLTQDMYIPDISVQIVQNSPNGLVYGNTQINLIAY